MRFEDKQNCYLDVKTGLEWSKENFGPMTWGDAVKRFNGSNGWRLPTIKELLELVDEAKYNPATELPGIKSEEYWSSTGQTYDIDSAWAVNFDNGCTYWGSKNYNRYVRAVRGERIDTKRRTK